MPKIVLARTARPPAGSVGFRMHWRMMKFEKY
jgi:hypothetical protein